MRLVLGVIGHVDHGKTALVRALTGMETDRLAEERRRGISIALGFAHLTLTGADQPVTIDLIDMPGHERFVRTMVSGATGVDAALLVVAANEGIKPQTVEHLDIAALLGLQQVIIAVNKSDLVKPAEAEAAGRQAAELGGARGLAVREVVLTSATTGAGLPALRAALLAAAPERRQPRDDGFAWLPIDRAFSVAGHGTVVTGTLRRGPLAISDDVEILPAGRPARLRGLQVHGARLANAQPGQRVAANLRDIAPADVSRGAALTTRGILLPSAWLTVALRAVDSAPELPSGTRLMLLFGTEEIACRLRLLDCDLLQPGGQALAQLHCAAPVAVPARERFILRRASPPATLAGGCILDPMARRLRRHAPSVVGGAVARARDEPDAAPAALLRAELETAGPHGVALARLARLTGLSEPRAAEQLAALPAIFGRSRVVVLRAAYASVLEALGRIMAADEADITAERLAAQLPWAGPAVLADAADELVRLGQLVRVGGALRRHNPARDQALARDEAASARRLAEALRQGGLVPPDPGQLMPGPQTRRLVDRLVREGVLIRAVDRVQKREVVFHCDAVEAAKRQLTRLLADGRGVLVGEAGAALGISRKYCVPLLEHLDAVQFTRRIADRRVLNAARPDRAAR